MGSIRRVLAATAAGLAMTAASIAVAAPAAASSDDGQGCAGFRAIPASSVCLIPATPGVLTGTTTSVPVTVPSVCHALGCTVPTTVQVPASGASGDVAVFRYEGRYHPIGIALGGRVLALPQDTIRLAGDTVNGVPQHLATTTELLQAVVRATAPSVTFVDNPIQEIVDNLPPTDEILYTVAYAIVRIVEPYLELADDLRWYVDDVLTYVLDSVPPLDPPTLQDVLDVVRDSEYYDEDLVKAIVMAVLERLPDLP